MQLIVPLAGSGKRFSDAGYLVPKPLVTVSGLPMIVRVVRDLPRMRRTVFIVRADHVRDFHIDRLLRRHVPGARIVVALGVTDGQACTVRLAAEEVDMKQDVLVAACDATHVYDEARFTELASEEGLDAIVWTYRGESRVLASPRSYGWVTADETGRVERVSCKQPISANLLEDRVASGFFWFRSARRLMDEIDALVESGERVNDEFYLDVIPNRIIAAGGRVAAFDVEKYIGWGTPPDFEDYLLWERYFAEHSAISHRAAG